MAETLGSLVDKLSIANLKIFHLQDKLYEAARNGLGLDAETTAKLASVNLERSKLATEIDVLFERSIRVGRADVNLNVKVES